MHDISNALNQLLARPIAHRGLHACGGVGPVENSLSAARAAVAAGFAIECDVQLSRDGEAMVFHDTSLDRLTGASGLVGDSDAAALSALNLRGSDDHIPTLAELLATIDGRTPLVIEIKNENGSDMWLVDRVLTLLTDYVGPVALESFDPRAVLHCRQKGVPRPVGLVGPPEAESEAWSKVDQTALAASDFLSWSIDSLADAARLYPSRPRSTWTVRTAAQAAVAARHGAQIVFEGFTPSSSVNRDAEQ